MRMDHAGKKIAAPGQRGRVKGSREGGENEKAAQDEVVMVRVCSGPRRMRIEREEEDCGVISHS